MRTPPPHAAIERHGESWRSGTGGDGLSRVGHPARRVPCPRHDAASFGDRVWGARTGNSPATQNPSTTLRIVRNGFIAADFHTDRWVIGGLLAGLIWWREDRRRWSRHRRQSWGPCACSSWGEPVGGVPATEGLATRRPQVDPGARCPLSCRMSCVYCADAIRLGQADGAAPRRIP
jgi:hypothetical protein